MRCIFLGVFMSSLLVFMSLILSFSPSAFAQEKLVAKPEKKERQLVQILHTNDLHGFLESTIADPKRGNYAALKHKMDEFHFQASERGIPTLRVDAGDFLDGNLFYLSDRGRRVWEIMNLMNYDAVAIGNHDWLMGAKDQNALLEEIPPNFQYLGANFVVTNPIYSNIRSTVKPYTTFELYGKKVGIMGLTTSELFYSWRFNGGRVQDAVKTGVKVEARMKEKGIDKVIALTHTGLFTDKKLVGESQHIDLVVGGHSHTAMFEPEFVKNKFQRSVPVVQSGSHGRWLGRLIVDIAPETGIEIVSYDLIPIYTQAQRDPMVDDYIKESRRLLNEKYGEEYLTEVIGETTIPLDSSVSRMTPWAKIVTEGMQEAVNADAAVHSPGFGGATIPPGPITREMVFNTHPRVFSLDDDFGWYIWKVDIYGVVIKSLLRLVLQIQQPVVFTGVTFDLIDRDNEILEVNPTVLLGASDKAGAPSLRARYLGIDGEFRIENIKINGKGINPFRKYRVALPEGIVVGGLGISTVVNYLLRQVSKTEVSLWESMNQKVERMKVIGPEFLLKDRPDPEKTRLEEQRARLEMFKRKKN